MKRRILSLFLALALLTGLFSGLAVTASAAEALTASEDCINILKYMEGFSAKPYSGYGQYLVGYGSSCGQSDYPNGITEEEADALLRRHVGDLEGSLNTFIQRNNLELTQGQFDALLMFTYNCGPSWMNASSNFRRAVLEGDKGNDFIFAMVQWSTAGGELMTGLVNRRLIEADMYLNGSYTNEVPSHYSYVTFVCPEGTACEVKVQGYDASVPTKVIAQPTRNGSRFLGWYTKETGGQWVTDLDATTTAKKLYAHWQADTVVPGADGTVTGTPASYERLVSASEGTKAYAAPNGDSEVKTVLEKGTKVTVKADYLDGMGVKWGQLSDGSWICLSDTAAETKAAVSSTPAAVKVTVTEDTLNVRAAAGDKYAKIRTAKKGEVLSVYRTTIVNGGRWGKTCGGWIYLPRTNYDAVLAGGGSDTGDAIAKGTVTAENSLNIRTGPGSNYGTEGTLRRGQTVYIYQITKQGDVEWGKIQNGWICLTYVDVEMLGGTTPSEPETPEEGGESTQPTEAVSGTIKCSTYLNIRKGPSTVNELAGRYANGTKVNILEFNSDRTWGRTDKGWISMNYVVLDTGSGNTSGGTTGGETGGTAGGTTGGTTGDASGGTSGETTTVRTGTVKCSTYLNIRKSATTGSASVGRYANGAKVTIVAQTTVGGKTWGQTDKGWIRLDYVVLDPISGGSDSGETGGTKDDTTDDSTGGSTGGEQPAGTQTGTVKCSSVLLIRSGAGTNHGIVGKLYNGDKVTILSKVAVGTKIWGQIKEGWICLAYVKLDTSGSGSSDSTGTTGDQTVLPFTGTVTASGLYIRESAGAGNRILGHYTRGTLVTILETEKVGATTWGRTEKGWISLAYVKY